MKRNSRLILYSVVLALPILSWIIYGNLREVLPFIILVVVIALVVEIVYIKQGKL